MKLKVTVVQETVYNIPDSDAQRIYGTTDPRECARIEAANRADDLIAVAKEKGQKVSTSHTVVAI